MLAADVARQRHHRRRAEQADVDARRGEARRFGGHSKITARHQLAAGSGGHAMHPGDHRLRSEEHTSELQSLMRISYAVFCLQKKPKPHATTLHTEETTPHIK